VSQTPRVGAHSRVVHPEFEAVQPTLLGKYGWMFPDLPSCEVDLDSAVALGQAASRMDATLPVADRTAEPGWRPTLPSSEVGTADLVVFAAATAEPSR
jgi:hypothetical protein